MNRKTFVSLGGLALSRPRSPAKGMIRRNENVTIKSAPVKPRLPWHTAYLGGVHTLIQYTVLHV